MSSTIEDYYSPPYLKFMESSERTGLLYEVALGAFDSGHVILSDGEGNSIVAPIVTESDWTGLDGMELVVEDEMVDDIDSDWMDRLFDRLDFQDAGEIWNGEVCQVKEVSDEVIRMNTSSYFTLASSREKYVAEIVDILYDAPNRNEERERLERSMGELEHKVYSLMGITYTTVISPPSQDHSYLLLGNRSRNMNELAGFRTVCPAGIVQPRHIEKENIQDMVRDHFIEEFSEEVLHEVMGEEEFREHVDSEYISYEAKGIGLDPLRYSTEIAATAHIEGDFADFVIENLSPNNEFESLELYEIGSIQSCYDPVFAIGLTPQSLFSLGLFLSDSSEDWTLTIQE